MSRIVYSLREVMLSLVTLWGTGTKEQLSSELCQRDLHTLHSYRNYLIATLELVENEIKKQNRAPAPQ